MSKHPQQERDEQLCKLMYHLFHNRFCQSEEVTQEQKAHVLPVYFCGWMDAQLDLMDPATECEEAGVEYQAWEFLTDLIRGGVGPERLTSIWPNVTLGDRPMPQHKLKSLTWNLLLTYEDGTIFPAQVHASVDMLEGPGFNDATVVAILTERFKEFVQPLLEMGIDGLHDRGDQYGGEVPFNVLMGAFLQIIPQLKPDLHAHLKAYMRLCQAMIQPPIPPEVKAQMEAKKRAAANPGKALGGWDA